MARFEREAQVLASLNHPNIARDLRPGRERRPARAGDGAGRGEDARDRIARGQLPLEEALRIARQIAEALEAAHESGIIHRDLKPANIKLTAATATRQDARLRAGQGAPGRARRRERGLTRSPTLSVAATQAGMILGTAGYMSPEQARARRPTAAPTSGRSGWSSTRC